MCQSTVVVKTKSCPPCGAWLLLQFEKEWKTAFEAEMEELKELRVEVSTWPMYTVCRMRIAQPHGILSTQYTMTTPHRT